MHQGCNHDLPNCISLAHAGGDRPLAPWDGVKAALAAARGQENACHRAAVS